MAGQADRTVIGKAQTFQQHDLAACADFQSGREGRIGGQFPQLQHAAGWLLVVSPDPFGKPRAGGYHVVDDVFGNEGAPALLYPEQPAVGKFLDGAANRVTVDTEAGGQFGLGGQSGAGRRTAGSDFLAQRICDLPPQGDAVLSRH